ncbi:MAG: hypothetical protein ACUVXA_11230 [Candidatus Jordarchaeum sp.]|uniref:hypothetical protein n=1 Tax=Candidatus Jordarchaeum sp. TaxID=2823881 RepID=UPI004049E742
MQQTPKEETKETAKQKNPPDLTDTSPIGTDMLYPCCIGGNCALYFYYEDLWRLWREQQKEQQKQEQEQKQQSEPEK